MAVQKDTLQVDFIINDAGALKKNADFQAAVKDTARVINDAGKNLSFVGPKMAPDLANATAKVQSLRAEIDQTIIAAKNSNSPAFRGFAAGADAAVSRARALSIELREIQATAARTTDPKIFASLQIQARAAEVEIDRLNAKVANVAAGRQASASAAAGRGALSPAQLAGRLNLSRQGADVFTTAAMGMSPAMIAIQQGPQILDAMATSGITLSKSMIATAAAVGGIAAAGYAVVLWTQSVRAQAEKALALEEKKQGIINKQILAYKELRDGIVSARAAAEQGRQFDAFTGGASIADLEARRASNQRLIDLRPSEDALRRLGDEQLRLDALIADARAKRDADQTQRFNQNWEDRKAAIADAARFEQEQYQKALAKIAEIGAANKTLFADLVTQRGAGNPFVAVFDEATRAAERTRETIKGLSPELRAAAEQMTAQAAGNALFGARLNNNLSVSDLRADAARFREADRPFVDPRILNDPRRGFGNLFLTGQGSDLNVQSLAGAYARQAAAGPADANASIRERFARQIDVIRNLRPENEAQRAEAERKVIELSRTVNPNDINAADSATVAAALENEAGRRGKFEQTARDLQTQGNEYQKAIADDMKALRKIAESDGLTGVIRFIDDTGRLSIETNKRAGDGDVAKRQAR